VFSLYLECPRERQDELSAELYERGTLGILELPSGLRAWFDDGVDVADFAARFDGEIIAEADHNWVQETHDAFPAFAIGEKFWLAPPWNTEPTPENRIRLEINPGAACGTGWHECTQMCLEFLERCVKPGSSVLDVGTGSGILSVAAKLLGAGRVIACDIDADAVAIARDRLDENCAYVGSADAVAKAAFDVIVANISPEAIRELASEFYRVAKPDANIILSGFAEFPLEIAPRELRRRGAWQCVMI
jgi:ribosomal protein L11 methyltransferase